MSDPILINEAGIKIPEGFYPKRESKGWTVFCYLVPLVVVVGILVLVCH